MYPWRSSFVILPFKPVAFTPDSSISNSLASLLTPGLANVLSEDISSTTILFFSSTTLGWVSTFSTEASTFLSISGFATEPEEISKDINGEPVFTSSPALTNTSFTTPSFSAGISILALSDSKTSIISSTETESPELTRISLTSAASMPSPKSGNKISFNILCFYWVRFIRINFILFNYFIHYHHIYPSFIC